jgi:hypothetical protein
MWSPDILMALLILAGLAVCIAFVRKAMEPLLVVPLVEEEGEAL